MRALAWAAIVSWALAVIGALAAPWLAGDITPAGALALDAAVLGATGLFTSLAAVDLY